MQSTHTDPSFAAEFDGIRQDVLLMAAHVESMFRDSWRAFQTRDVVLARDTSTRDHQVDVLERVIDARCLRVLARWKPVASDLRFVTSVLKIVTSLERVGDLSAAVCRRTVQLSVLSGVPDARPLVGMADSAAQMVTDAIDAFSSGEVERARSVVRRDHIVDTFYAQCYPELLALMASHPDKMPAAMCLADVAKSVERVADHATNIGELVVFMVEGHRPRRTAVVSEVRFSSDRLLDVS